MYEYKYIAMCMMFIVVNQYYTASVGDILRNTWIGLHMKANSDHAAM